MSEELLRIEGIIKAYPGTIALNNVSMSFEAGKVHAIMGANGAGKSTLMKVLSGAIKPDSGTIWFDGKQYSAMTPQQSLEAGISTIYQEFNLIPGLPVMENVFMGKWPGKKAYIDKKEMVRRTRELFDMFEINVSPYDAVSSLSPALQQIVEIVKAVTEDIKLLILDEPTAALTVHEVDILFDVVRKLKARGITIFYISHRLEEIFEISDDVYIMRNGCYIDRVNTAETSRQELISLMVGHEFSGGYPEGCNATDEVVFEAEHVTGNGVKDISFQLHRGEILGFGGLVGCGRSELMNVLFGAAKMENGTVKLMGKELDLKSCDRVIDQGLGFVTEDRKATGLLLDKTPKVNMSLASLRVLSKMGLIDKKLENQKYDEYKQALMIKIPNDGMEVQKLSGGNQQKVIVAKWLMPDCDVLIVDEPTRGIDVAAKQEIYRLMRSLTAEGKSIIMVSSELDELFGMSDRIIVLSEGEFAGEVAKEQFSKEHVLDLASGVR